MKPILALGAVMFAACAVVSAQETTGDRVVVPARNSSRPRQVNATTLNGSITVKTYNGKDVIVETAGGRRADRESGGMRRIDAPRGLDVTEEDNVITVRLNPPAQGSLVITVPPDTSLKIKSNQGAVTAEGVRGEVEAKSLNGAINLTNISGAVVADTLNGALNIKLDRVDPAKPMSFSTLNGAIDVTLPADTKANLKMRTDHGEIYSDFEIKLTGGSQDVQTRRPGDSKDAQFRVRFDRTMFGTINGGGPELSFRTLNGTINIRKK